jgi:hypothetical protein
VWSADGVPNELSMSLTILRIIGILNSATLCHELSARTACTHQLVDCCNRNQPSFDEINNGHENLIQIRR